MSVKQFIPGIKYGNQVGVDEQQGGCINPTTSGTTAVSVFGTDGLTGSAVVTGVMVTALDTTAGNITVENPVGTVIATVAKGTVSGVVTGAVTLANTTINPGVNVIVKSSTAGNAKVTIFFA